MDLGKMEQEQIEAVAAVKLHIKKARGAIDKIMSRKFIEIKEGLYVRIKDQYGYIHPGTIKKVITAVGIQCGEKYGTKEHPCITISAICSIMFVKDIFIEKHFVDQNDVNGVN
jgi:hypothetical protein